MNGSPQSTPDPALARKPSAIQQWLQDAATRVKARNGLLVVRQGDVVKTVVSIPPQDLPDRSMLLVAERALRERKVLVRPKKRAPGAPADTEQIVYVGLAMRIAGRPSAVVFRIFLGPTEYALDDAVLLQTFSSATLRRADDHAPAVTNTPTESARVVETPPAKPRPLPAEAPQDPALSALVAEQAALLSSIAALVDQNDLEQSLHGLANRIAKQFRCLRVYLGVQAARSIQIRAVSGLVEFDAKAAVMVDVVQAMQETRVLGTAICLPDARTDQVPPPCHASLAEQLNNPALLSVPLASNGSVVGVLMLERDCAFVAQEVAQLERLALLLSPLLSLKRTDSMGLWQWLSRYSGRGLRSVFGSQRLGLKLGLLLLTAAVLTSATVTQTFRVDANASIEATQRRAVVSGVPSFLSQVEKRAGDLVEQGDVLARLDVEDLQLDRIKLLGEKEKLVKEYRANLAQRDRSKVRVLEAQRSQAQAKIDLIDAQIERAVLRAPITGVVLSGDLDQALGRPVERGELLFEVASLEEYRLVLELDERDIGWVQTGSTGHLRLRSLAERTFPFTVTSVTPVSTPGGGANVFRIEAAPQGLPDTLRPGMEGVAKITVEPRAVGWIWTRSFVNWVRMQLWKVGGL